MTPEEYVEAVLSFVEQIPPAHVMTYGAIADALADDSGRNSARRVGTIMARHGAAVPWHRVVGAGGRLPPGHEQEARRRLESEGTSFRGDKVAAAAHLTSLPQPPTTASAVPITASSITASSITASSITASAVSITASGAATRRRPRP